MSQRRIRVPKEGDKDFMGPVRPSIAKAKALQKKQFSTPRKTAAKKTGPQTNPRRLPGMLDKLAKK